MKKAYRVELVTVIVVMADSAVDAMSVARDHDRDAISDCGTEIGTPVEVTSVSELDKDWDGDCIPYGGDGNTPLKDLLTHNVELRGAHEKR